MKRIVVAAAAAAVLGILAAPAAQAEPEFCDTPTYKYIPGVCAPQDLGGGGPKPFYAVVHDPVTRQVVKNPITGKTIKTCRSACDKLAPEDRTIND